MKIPIVCSTLALLAMLAVCTGDLTLYAQTEETTQLTLRDRDAVKAGLPEPPTAAAVSAQATKPAAAAFSSGAVAAVVAPVEKTPNSKSPWQTKLDRWVVVDDLSFGFRYRKEIGNTGVAYFHDGQQKSLIDGQFKFDPAGKYSVRFDVSSGRTFNWAYTDEIWDDFNKLALAPSAFAAASPGLPGDLYQ